MKRLSAFLASAFAVLFILGPGQSQPNPVPDARIYQAVAFGGKLWLLEGSVVVLDLATGARTAPATDGAVALLRAKDRLWLLQARGGGARRFVVAQWQGGGFHGIADFTAEKDDQPVALAALQGDPVIVTRHSVGIYSALRHRWQRIPFKNPMGFFGQTVAAAAADGSALYIGFNRGEWGGGMVRIDFDGDRRGVLGPDMCKGPTTPPMPLAPGAVPPPSPPYVCGNVTAIIADPGKPGCVLVATGLIHFSSSGQVVGVCRDRLTKLFERPIRNGKGALIPFESEAFFGLAPAPQGFWTVSDQGLYRVAPDGGAQAYPMPKLKPLGGVWLTRALPGMIVVRTDMNRAYSLSGDTPLLVPLD